MSVEASAKVLTYGGGMTAVYGWFTVTEWCAIAGALAAIAGLAVQAILAAQKYRHARESHGLDMEIKRATLDQIIRGVSENR